jgi:integrase
MSRILTTKEMEAMLKQTKAFPSGHYWNAVIGVMAYAGLEEREVIELLLEDVDLGNGLIRVRSIEDSGNARKVQISENLLALLERRPANNSNYVFPNIQANAKPWFKSSFDSELQKRLPEGVKPVDLINSFGSFESE